jgi:hypothetical protein
VYDAGNPGETLLDIGSNVSPFRESLRDTANVLALSKIDRLTGPCSSSSGRQKQKHPAKGTRISVGSSKDRTHPGLKQFCPISTKMAVKILARRLMPDRKPSIWAAKSNTDFRGVATRR